MLGLKNYLHIKTTVKTILDNCIGSGTTVIAAINTKRNYIGFELDKNYFNIAQERIKNNS